MIARLTVYVLIYLFDMLIFVFVILTKKKKKKRKKERNQSIITFHTLLELLCFFCDCFVSGNWPSSMLTASYSIERCILPNSFEYCPCLFIKFYFIVTRRRRRGIQKWLSCVHASVPKLVTTTLPRRHIRLS